MGFFLSDSGKEIVQVYYRKGTTDDPFIFIEETLKVVNNRVILKEIPDSFNKVTVKDLNNNSLTETTNPFPAPNYYYVDYNLGRVIFNDAQDGQTFVFSYYGKGVAYISSERVVVETNGEEPTKTLQDLVDESSQALEADRQAIQNKLAEADAKIAETETARQDAIDATNNANAQATYAQQQGDYAKSVADQNKTVWKTPVANFAAIATTYPSPQHGWTVQTIDNGKIYRYNSATSTWEYIQEYNNTAITDLQNQLSKQNQQSTTIGHGLNIINATQNSPLDIRIEGRTLVNVSQNVLDPAKYYVLSGKNYKVKFSDGTTYAGVSKFAGKAEKPILIRVSNFEGKVAGSTLENPHKFQSANTYTSLTNSPSFGFEPTDVNLISSLNGSLRSTSSSVNGVISQQLFSFNLIEAIERNVGKIPASDTAGKVAWLKNNINTLTIRWHGNGSSPSGNKASLAVYNNTTSTWVDTVNHTNGSVTQLTFTISGASIADRIDANGFIHFLAYAEPSNGTVASTINTDYVELETELKQNAQLWNPRFPLYEVDATEYANILTTWDENEVLRRYPMVESVQHVQNPYVIAEGENLLPPFTEWTLHANAVVREPYKLELNATGVSQASSIILSVLPNQTYTISGGVSANAKFRVNVLDVNGNLLNQYDCSGAPITFTTSANASKINVFASNTSTGTFTFTNPMLTLGAAKPFVPRNPSYLFAEVKLGALSDKKDILFKDNGEWKVLKWVEKDIPLDGKLAWAFAADYTGFKNARIDTSIFNGYVTNYSINDKKIVKWNGVILKAEAPSISQQDTFTVGSSNSYGLTISISDTDSGWTEHYKPSSQEIQAYFNGWKANGYTTGTAVTNELTGQLAPSGTYTFANAGAYRNIVVEKSTDGSTWSPAVENTDFSININSSSKAILTNLNASPLYFRISYNYGVTVNSWASLVDGSAPATNTLTYVSANLAPNFTPYKLSYVRSTPVTEIVTDKVEGDLVVNGATQVEVGSGFTYTEVDGKRTYTKLAPNARYNVTANILSVIANYDTSLKSVVDSVVAKQSDIAAQVGVNVRAIAELYKRVKALGG